MSKKTLSYLLPIFTFMLGMFVVSLTGAAQTVEKTGTPKEIIAAPAGGGVSTQSIIPTTNSNINRNGNFSVPFILQNRLTSCTNCTGQDTVNELMIDVNGDGLVDVANIDKDIYTGKNSYLNNGDGTWIRGSGPLEPDAYNTAIYHYTDINGDGKVEQLETKWINSNGLHYLYIYGLPVGAPAQIPGVFAERAFERGVHFMDVNSDNLPDIVISGFEDGSSIDYLYKAILLNKDGGFTWEKVFEQKVKG